MPTTSRMKEGREFAVDDEIDSASSRSSLGMDVGTSKATSNHERDEIPASPAADLYCVFPASAKRHSNGASASSSSLPTLDRWSRMVKSTHGPILSGLQAIARLAVNKPWIVIGTVSIVSLLLIGTGVTVGDGINMSTGEQFTPSGSVPYRHGGWIGEHFVAQRRFFTMLIHGNGADILEDGVEGVFTALDTILSLPFYDDMCIDEETGTNDCEVYSIASYWDNNIATFRNSSAAQNRTLLGQAISKSTFSNGDPAPLSFLYGNARQEEGWAISSVQSYSVTFFFTPGSVGRSFEASALEAALALREEWRGSGLEMELSADSSLTKELERTIRQDIPLVPIIFVIMSLFMATALARSDPVRSRSLLGVAAVCAVFLSIASGFGLLFLCKVPFSSLTQILPFIIFGIGLDDAFIIMGSYERTDPLLPIEDRIYDTIDDVGLSITLTTLTSALAFGLGCMSSVFGVYWLCLYAFPTIILVFLYQMTFFVACIVLDERRVQARKRDIFVCCQVKHSSDQEEQEHFADRIMGIYGKVLLLKPVKFLVVAGFTLLFLSSCWSASKFEEEFDVTEALPRDSYVVSFADAYDSYHSSNGLLKANIYFRNVDQSLPEVRQQMRDYIKELQVSPYFSTVDSFWLDFFEIYEAFGDQNRTFTERVDGFLSIPLYNKLFDRDISRDPDTNEVIGTRVQIGVDVNVQDTQEQIEALLTQREVTLQTAMNHGTDENSVFAYDGVFKIWEFLRIAKRELFSTAAICVVAVSLVAALFIPHWTAVVFVFPLICVLYVDLLGMMQWAGLHINPVSYVSLAMSIGLLVDFVMHVLFRFYELPGTREEKVLEMLRTMGSSILLGGTTTFLGTIPLMFSSTDIFQTVFFAFLGIVTLGIGHGLILVPVLLSLFGPEVEISMRSSSSKGTGSVSRTSEESAKDLSSLKGSHHGDSDDGGNDDDHNHNMASAGTVAGEYAMYSI